MSSRAGLRRPSQDSASLKLSSPQSSDCRSLGEGLLKASQEMMELKHALNEEQAKASAKTAQLAKGCNSPCFTVSGKVSAAERKLVKSWSDQRDLAQIRDVSKRS